MKSLCVFCGSNSGNDPQFVLEGCRWARLMVEQGLTVVYGGASIGLMAMVANEALQSGGKVLGVIPAALFPKEIPHRGLTELHVVATMHERKQRMYDLSDGFVALPGGLGTLDELFEILTWAQLGLHRKPCGILNIRGYFDPLLEFLRRAVKEGMMRPEHLDLCVVDPSPEALLKKMREYRPPVLKKWIGVQQT